MDSYLELIRPFLPNSQNTIVLMSLTSVHHDSERWTDPEVFRPERYLTDKGEFIQDEGLCTFGLGKLFKANK